MSVLEIIVASVITVGIGWLAIYGSLVASYEKEWRRKNFEAGTHDYYGNKLDVKE
jgi:hypothetical protein